MPLIFPIMSFGAISPARPSPTQACALHLIVLSLKIPSAYSMCLFGFFWCFLMTVLCICVGIPCGICFVYPMSSFCNLDASALACICWIHLVLIIYVSHLALISCLLQSWGWGTVLCSNTRTLCSNTNYTILNLLTGLSIPCSFLWKQ